MNKQDIVQTLEQAEKWGVEACKVLNMTLDDLYELPAEELYEKLNWAGRQINMMIPSENIDGWFLPKNSAAAVNDGTAFNKPVMGGSNGGDIGGPACIMHFPGYEKDTRSWQRKDAAERIGKLSEKLFDKYDPEDPANEEIYKTFTDEIWFVFGTLERCFRQFDGRYYDLMHKVQAYWVNFAKTGNPNGPGLPEWSAYDLEKRSMLFMTENEVKTVPVEKKVADILNAVFE